MFRDPRRVPKVVLADRMGCFLWSVDGSHRCCDDAPDGRWVCHPLGHRLAGQLLRYRDGELQRLVEAKFRGDPDRWARYQRTHAELVAWNWLESAVALALSASLVGVLAILIG